MNVQDYLWYPYIRYQEECRKAGKEDSIQEFLIITGKVEPPPNSVVVDSVKPIKKKRRTRVKKTETTKPKSVIQRVKDVVRPKRARNSKGQYIKNDPTTNVNEAWEGGKAPPQKRKRTK